MGRYEDKRPIGFSRPVRRCFPRSRLQGAERRRGRPAIIYQPDFIIDDALRQGGLVPLELDEPTIELGIQTLYPPEKRPPAKTQVMIDFLAEALARARRAPK